MLEDLLCYKDIKPRKIILSIFDLVLFSSFYFQFITIRPLHSANCPPFPKNLS